MKSIVQYSVGLGLVLVCPVALGNVHDTFGVGSVYIAQGNAVTASVKGGAAAYFNPAALARTSGIQLEAGFQTFIPRFSDFEGIVYDRNQNGSIDLDENGNPETTTVGAQYAPSQGLGLTAAIPITSWLVAGVSAYVPQQYMMRLSFEDPYIPYYALYKNRTQRFSVYPGIGIKVFDGLYLGVGTCASAQAVIEGHFSSTVNVTAGQTDENGNPIPAQINGGANIDSMTVALKGSASPTVGLLLNFGWVADPLAGLNLGASFRSASSVKSHAEIGASAGGTINLNDEVLYSGAFLPEPIAAITDMTSSFNPAQAALGLSYAWKDRLTVSADATYTRWSDYHETLISVQKDPMVIEGVAVINFQVGRDISDDPGTVWKDTVTPRLGVEYVMGMPRGKDLGFQVALRGGYGFHPSPVPEQTANTNMMDSDKHMFSGGVGFVIPLPRLAKPLRVDMYASYQQLVDRAHIKALDPAPEETGAYLPGYPLGGAIVSRGSILGFGGSAGLTF